MASPVQPYPQVWDLETLHPHPIGDGFPQQIVAFRQRLADLVAQSEELAGTAPSQSNALEWGRFLLEYEAVDAFGTELRAHVECHSAADASNAKLQQLESALSALGPQREQIATNLELSLALCTPEGFEAWLASHSELKQRAFYLRQKRLGARFRLPKENELLASELAVDGIFAWGRLYDRLCAKLRVDIPEGGKMVTKSVGQVHFDSPQRAVREQNFRLADSAWKTIAEPCAEALNHIAGTRLTIYRRLGLRDHLEHPLYLNRMTRGTLDAMWSEIAAFTPNLCRYLAKKAELMGLPGLTWFDVMAPLPVLPGQPAAENISYDSACQQIVGAFQKYDFALGGFAEMSLRQSWVEAEDRSGKRQGGFCTTFPASRQSRIFMTYTGTADSMSTLAHELGHAYHSWVLKDQPWFLGDYPMNLAETASTFAEAVLADDRIRQVKNLTERLGMLDSMLGDSVAFLMNIRSRFLFENAFHVERAQGEVSVERLNELMVAAQREAFCGGLVHGGENESFWISKLHFYITGVPFYNFPYTFGYLLSLGLYALGEEVGAEFPDRYRQLLVATGCETAEDAVRKSFGFDLSAPDFWKKSLQIVDRRISQFIDAADDLLTRCRS